MPPDGKGHSRTSSDHDDLTRFASQKEDEGASGVYVVLNPLREGLDGTPIAAKDVDVIHRRWLPLDVDPVREAHTSATDEEIERANLVWLAARDLLEEDPGHLRGPVVVMSGNGWHAVYPILLPNNRDTRDLIQQALKWLDRLCSTPAAEVDTSVCNASRILKVPGTLARKGDHLPDRPHRRAELHDAPPWDEDVARHNAAELIRLAALWAEPEAAPRRSFAGKASPNGESDGWLLRPGDDFEARGPDLLSILTAGGWADMGDGRNGERRVRRPGKTRGGCSGTVGAVKGSAGEALFHCFTCNASPFEPGRNYGKFRTYAHIHHDGDLKAAATDLHRQNYGTRKPKQKAQAAGGSPPPASPATATGPAPGSGTAIILDYFREHYRPEFKRGNAVRSADGRDVFMAEACAAPTSALIARLAEATDAPCFSGGGVKMQALPGFFRTWSKVAWADLLASLPDEDEAELGPGSSGQEEFRRLVRDAMLSDVVLGETLDGEQTCTQRRPLIDWCRLLAKSTTWGDIRGRRCFCKLILDASTGENVLTVAIRPELFGQLKADRRLCGLTMNALGKRAQRYGVGAPAGRKDRPQGCSVVILAREFVEDLLAQMPEIEEEGEVL